MFCFKVIWDGSKRNNEIGVGISSNEKHTIIVVQYDNSKSQKIVVTVVRTNKGH